MKRIFIISILAVICGLTAMAQNRPDMTHQTSGGDRDYYQKGAVINYDANTQTLSVIGSIIVTYFELTITSIETQETVFYDMFEGNMATIPVGYLNNGSIYLAEYVDSMGKTCTKMFMKSSVWFDNFDINLDWDNSNIYLRE